MHILLVLRFTAETFFTDQWTRPLAAMHVTVQMEGSPIQIQGFPWETGIYQGWSQTGTVCSSSPPPGASWAWHWPECSRIYFWLSLPFSDDFFQVHSMQLSLGSGILTVLGFTWVAESEFREQLIPRPHVKKWRARCVLVMDFSNTELFLP